MSQVDRLRKLREEKEAKEREERKQREDADAKKRDEFNAERARLSNYLNEHIRPILEDTNQALADGQGSIYEHQIEPSRYSVPWLTLKWNIHRETFDADTSESGNQVDIGLRPGNKVWIRVGIESNGVEFSLNDMHWKDKIEARIAEMYKKNRPHYG